MAIHLPEDVERSLRAAVSSGDFASADEALAAAWRAFSRQRTQPKGAEATALDQLHRQMLADGLITQLPNPDEDIDDDEEEPIVIPGELLSETIIRERR